MHLEQYTDRIGLSGQPYPRCQHSLDDIQCNKSTYSDGKCWTHYFPLARPMFNQSSKPI